MPGTVALVAVMIGTVTFDGLSQGEVWGEGSAWCVDLFDEVVGADTAVELAGTVGLLAGWGWWPGSTGSAWRARSRSAAACGGRLRARSSTRLMPIAVVYAMRTT